MTKTRGTDMLKLIRPDDPGQKTRRPRRSQSTLSLTEAETRQLRLVLKTLHGQYGSWPCLAEVLGVDPKTVNSIATGRKRGSPGILLRAARAAGLPLERILIQLSLRREGLSDVR
jgi:hypothetical protein